LISPARGGIVATLAGVLLALLPVVGGGRLWTFWPIYLGWLVLVFGIDLLLSPRRERVRLTIETPEMLYIGSSDRAVVRLDLGTPRPLAVELTVDLSPELRPQPRLVARVGRLPVRLEVALEPTRRGTAVVQAVWVRYRGPLGFVAHTHRIPAERRIPVVPNLLPVRSVALRFFADRDFRAGLKIERFKGEGTEFDSLKEFVRGDDSRAIHWRASARHRRLLCRQFRAERNHQIVVALDTGRLMGETLAGIPKLDHALNAALLLSYVCLRAGDRVGLFSFASSVGLYFEPQAGMRTQLALTRISSGIDYSATETNYTLGLTTLAQRLRRRSLIIVLTDFVDTVTAELMVENLTRLARRHLVVFVSLRDPAVAGLAAAPPIDSLALNRAVVAQDMARDREIVLRRLGRMGIGCLDVPPDKVGSRLINSYLDIKRREMI
jgi:uncharacterized protein (DUF58 family)